MKEGYKKTELGFIPNEWEVKRIGEIFDFSGGLSISRENLTNDGVNYLHYGDIHKRTENFIDVDIDEKWLPKITQDFQLIKETVKLNDGDVVFADASEDYNGIGKSVAILNKNCKPFVAGLHTIIGKDNSNILDRNYKRFCFSLNSVRLQFRKLATGTSVYGISRENIKKINILIPSLKEQEKIADILSTVDSQIADTDKLIEKTKDLKKGLMQRLLTKGVGHKEFKNSKVGKIPVEWELKSLFEVANFNNGKAHEKNISEEGQFIVVNSKFISTEGEVKKYSNENICPLNKGDIAIVMSDVPNGRAIGKCYLIDEENKYTLNQRIGCLKTEYMHKKFLFYYLNRNSYYLKFDDGVKQTNLKKEEVLACPVIIPSIEEQKRISNILETVDFQIEEYKSKKIKLEELKTGLMQQLLTGKIRVV